MTTPPRKLSRHWLAAGQRATFIVKVHNTGVEAYLDGKLIPVGKPTTAI